MKAATPLGSYVSGLKLISIHAAREGGDHMFQHRFPACKNISIHAAREGGDRKVCKHIDFRTAFQSTPPVKAATTTQDLNEENHGISIHAAREGGDG